MPCFPRITLSIKKKTSISAQRFTVSFNGISHKEMGDAESEDEKISAKIITQHNKYAKILAKKH